MTMSSSLLILTGLASDTSCFVTALAAFFIPRLSAIASAPAARLRYACLNIASVRTVAVVVPSPATFDVSLAASLTNVAPRFSFLSSRSISFATVTPSLVTVGPPQLLSIRAFRPLGPRVDLTAFASFSTPASSPALASDSNANSLTAIAQHLLNTLYYVTLHLKTLKSRVLYQIRKRNARKTLQSLFRLFHSAFS